MAHSDEFRERVGQEVVKEADPHGRAKNATEKELREEGPVQVLQLENEMRETHEEVMREQTKLRKGRTKMNSKIRSKQRQMEYLQEIEMCAQLDQMMHKQCSTQVRFNDMISNKFESAFQRAQCNTFEADSARRTRTPPQEE